MSSDPLATLDLDLDLDLKPNERVWYSAPAALPALRILHARESSRLWKVWHETFTICSCHAVWDEEAARDGSAQWRYRGQQLSTTRGELMLMEPGECHVTQKIVGVGTFDVLQLDPSYVHEVAGELGIDSAVHLRTMGTSEPNFRHAINGLLEAACRAEGRLEQEHALYDAVSLLVRHHAEQARDCLPALLKVHVRRAIDYIT